MSFIKNLMKDAIRIVVDHLGTDESEIVYTRLSDGQVLQVKGVIDEKHEVVITEGEAAIGSRSPTLLLSLEDLGFRPRRNDQVEYNGISYDVVEIREDSLGEIGVELLLHRIG